jgi:ectoine hydroxylase-related dioxygenase (phytanoyl-CoA dioxygenase family)
VIDHKDSTLDIKPPGGSGFAPHVDTPSLQQPFSSSPPSAFWTVMIAIDHATSENGCLRLAHPLSGQAWNEAAIRPFLVAPDDVDNNPDGNGRAGALDPAWAAQLNYDDVQAASGTVVVFHGHVPHASQPNQSPIAPRRAVFLTYNLQSEGDHHEAYYQRMNQLRREYQQRHSSNGSNDQEAWLEQQRLPEWEALNTIPKI